MNKNTNSEKSIKQMLLIGGLTLLTTPFFYSTLISQSQHYWKLTGSYLQTQWTNFLDVIGYNDFYLYVIGIILSIQISFWGLGSIYIFMDLTGWPKWARKYKVQPGTNEPVDSKKLIETIKVCLFNQWVIATPLFIISYYLKKATNTIPPVDELPTFQRYAIDLFIMTVIDEIGLYYVHRLQHHPRLYSWVHKKHHEWSAPIAITFVYATPTEYLMNAVPVTLGPLVTNPHIITLWSWYILVHYRGVKNHSDYKFPWIPTPEEHDFHHMASNACFGKTIYMDWLHGTDKPYRAYLERKKLKEQQEKDKLLKVQ